AGEAGGTQHPGSNWPLRTEKGRTDKRRRHQHRPEIGHIVRHHDNDILLVDHDGKPHGQIADTGEGERIKRCCNDTEGTPLVGDHTTGATGPNVYSGQRLKGYRVDDDTAYPNLCLRVGRQTESGQDQQQRPQRKRLFPAPCSHPLLLASCPQAASISFPLLLLIRVVMPLRSSNSIRFWITSSEACRNVSSPMALYSMRFTLHGTIRQNLSKAAACSGESLTPSQTTYS